MLHINKWSPDTCGCVLQYQWDDSLPSEQRVHVALPADKLCSAHNHLTDHIEHHSKIVAENQNKNRTINALLKSLPRSEKKITLDGDGNEQEDFLTPPVFSFVENRTLKIKHKGQDLDLSKLIK